MTNLEEDDRESNAGDILIEGAIMGWEETRC